MAYGIKVRPQIEAAEVDVEELRKAIQTALDEHTKNNPIIVKDFTATQDQKKIRTLRNAVQKALEEATKKNKVMIKNFGATLNSKDKREIINQLSSDLDGTGLTLKIDKIDASKAVVGLRKQLTDMLSGLSITGLKEFLGTEGVEATYNKAAEAADRLADSQGNLGKKSKEASAELKKLSDMQTVLGNVYRGLFDFEDKDVRDDLSGKIKAALEKIKKAQGLAGEEQVKLTAEIENTVAAIKSQSEAYKKAKTAQAQQARQAAAAEEKAERERAKQARQAASEQAKAAREQEAAEARAAATAKKTLSLKTQIQKWIQNNAVAYQQYKSQVDALMNELDRGGGVSASRLEEIRMEFGEIGLQAIKSRFSVSSLFAAMKVGVNQLKGFLLTKEAFQKMWEVFKKMLTAVKEVDAATTELRKVTDLTSKEYEDFEKTAANTARSTGALLSDTINATADFARLGFDLNDAHSLAEAALVYKNVGDGIDNISTSTESLISTIKAFGLEANDAMFIVDKFNEVGNNFAISSSGIGEALSRSASALASAGNDIDESIGLITAMNSVVQNPEVVGTSLKTISMYLRAAKTEAEEAGISTDGMANSVSELRHELMRLTGIDIMIDDSTFKSTFQIMQELSVVWKDLTDISQANVLNLIGGKRNGNVITSLLTNFDDAVDAMEASQKALGSASKENEKYLDSINGQLTKLKANFQALSNAFIDNEAIKNLLKIVNALIESLTKLEEHGHLASTALTLMIDASVLHKFGLLSVVWQKFVNVLKTVATVIPALFKHTTVAPLGSIVPVLSNVTAVLAPLTAAITMLNAVHQHTINQAERAAGSYNYANKSYKANIKTIEELTDRYKELSAGVEDGKNVSLTAKEYAEYEEIIQKIANIAPDLVESYDKEGVRLRDYTSVIEDATKAQEGYLSASKQAYYDNSNAKNMFVKWKDDYQEARRSLAEYSSELGNVVRAHGFSSFGMNQNIWRSALENIDIDLDINDVWSRMSDDAFKKIYEDSDAFIYHLRNAAEQTGQYMGDELDTWIGEVQTAISDLGTPLREMNQVMLQEAEYLINKMEHDLAENKQESLINAVIPTDALDEFRAGLAETLDPHGTFNENLEATKKYTEDFAAIIQSDIGQSLVRMIKGLEDGTISTKEFNAEMTILQALFEDNPALQGVIDYFEGLAINIDSIADKAKEAGKNIQGLSVVLSGVSKSRSVTDAVAEDLREFGFITYDTLQMLADTIGETDKITKYIKAENGKLEFQQEEWNKRGTDFWDNENKAYEEQNTLLEARNKELRESIASAEAFINKTDGYNADLFKDAGEATTKLSNWRAELEKNSEAIRHNSEMIEINKVLMTQNEDALSASERLTNKQNAESVAKEMISIYEQAQNEIKEFGEVQADTLISARNLLGEEAYMDYFGDFGMIESKVREFVQNVLAAADVDTPIVESIMESIGIDVDAYEAMRDNVGKLQEIASWYQDAMEDMKDGVITDPEIYIRATELFDDQIDKILKSTPDDKGYELIENGLITFRDEMIETADIAGPFAAMILGLFAKDPDTTGLDKLTNAIGKVGNIKSLMDTINSELSENGTNTLDTLGGFIKEYGEGWEKHVNFDNGIHITAGALRELALAGINELEIEEARKQQLIELAEAELNAAAANKEIKDSYDGLKTAVSAYGEIGSAQELSYETIKGLIDIDSQYAKAIEYQNGRLQLNKEKFDEVTEAVKRKALADAEAKAQAILAGEEYQGLLAKMGTDDWTDSDQNRFDSLNAQVMAFHVLESEIDNSTSALQRFLNATDRVNAVTYDGAKDAYQTIKDVLYNEDSDMYGMIGHEKFQEAIRLMISPEIEIDSPEFKKQFKILERYFEDSKAGMSTLYDDMLKKGVIDKTTGQINTTVAEAAELLGLTENALRLAVDQFNQYQKEENKIDIGGKTTPEVEEEAGLNKAIKDFETLQENVEGFKNTPLDIPVDPTTENLNAVNSALSTTQEKVADQNDTPIDVKFKLPDNMSREQLGEYMDQLYGSGNVKMTTRPVVELDDGSIATVLSQTFGAGDRAGNESYDFQYDQNIVINATPILPDGTVIDEESFRDYIGELVQESSKTGKSVLELDSKGVIINVTPVVGDIESAYQAAGIDMELLHMMQDAFYNTDALDTSAFEKRLEEINQYILESGVSLQEYKKTIEAAGDAKLNTDKAEESVGAVGEAAQMAKENVDQTQASVGTMQESLDQLNDTPLSINVKGALDGLGQVYRGLINIIDKLEQISKINAVANVTVQQTTTAGTVGSAIGGAVGSLVGKLFGDANASGTQRSAGGKTLTGELGPETVVDPYTNKWYIVGTNGPEFVDLPKNAIVFNAEQTKSLFERGRTKDRGQTHGTAMATGNAAADVFFNTIKTGIVEGYVEANKKQNTSNAEKQGPVQQTTPSVSKSGATSSTNLKPIIVQYVEANSSSKSSSSDPMTGNPEKPKTSSSKKSSSSGGGSSGSSKEDEMTVLEKLEEKYQKLLETQEHLIEHQEFLYRQAEKGLDYKGMETSLQKQVEIYKDLMADAQKGISEMVANGASDTDEELQNLERAYWDAWDSMYETLDEIAALYVEALQDKMDGIQGAYSDFAKAADELAESGGISVDTFQSLIENGVQYMSLLEKVNGQYVINEDGINKLVAAEKKRLAVESALSYLMQVQQALNDKDTYLLENLADVSNRIGQSSWDAVYAQAALLKNLGLSDDQYAVVLENINALKAISENVTSDITADAESATDKITNGLEDQQDALDEILKLTQDLIEHETEERIDAIEDEIEAYREIIELKKKSLETTKDENDYMDSVAEKTAEIAKLQAKMDQLSLDDSREAAAERASIAEQLKEMQKELSDLQEDHSYDAQVEALDKQADTYEESRQQEITDLENSISSAEKLYQASIDRLNAGWSTLYKELIDWNTEVGNSLNSEITEAWERAAEAVKLYGSYSAAIKGIEYETENGGGKNVAVTNKVPVFHDGGVVGKGDNEKEEVLALLEKGEIVIERDGQKHLYKIIDFQKELAQRLGKQIGELNFSALDLSPAFDATPKTEMVNTTTNNDSRSFVFNPQIDVRINHSGNTTDREAKSFGKRIASTVADELMSAFEASGFVGSMRTRLRQA